MRGAKIEIHQPLEWKHILLTKATKTVGNNQVPLLWAKNK